MSIDTVKTLRKAADRTQAAQVKAATKRRYKQEARCVVQNGLTEPPPAPLLIKLLISSQRGFRGSRFLVLKRGPTISILTQSLAPQDSGLTPHKWHSFML
jgi:hypothetical protein